MKSLIVLAAAVTLSASTFTGIITPDSGDINADVTVDVTLADNCNPCSASSILFSNVPNGLTFTGDATTWSVQVANTFYVANGVLTSFQFLAANPTGNGNFQLLAWNNILGPKNAPTNPSYPSMGIQAPTGYAVAEDYFQTTLNYWVQDQTSLFGESLNGGSVVQPSGGNGGAPEPADWTLIGIGLAVWAVWKGGKGWLIQR